MQRRKDKSKVKGGRSDSNVEGGEASVSSDVVGVASAGNEMSEETEGVVREVRSGVECSVVQSIIKEVGLDSIVEGGRANSTDSGASGTGGEVAGNDMSDAIATGGIVMGHRASGASDKESEMNTDDRDEGGKGDGARSEVNEEYINRMIEDEYELINDDGSEYVRWEGGDDNGDDIDNRYVRYEGEVSDDDINRMLDSMQAGSSSGLDDADINRMIDSMQVDGGGNRSSGSDTSPGDQCGDGGSEEGSSGRASAIHNKAKEKARAKGNAKKGSICRGQRRRVQTLTRWTVESRNKMIAALKYSHGVT